MKIILASASPRRRELLGTVCRHFDIKVAEVDETLPEGTHPREGVELLAIRKGHAVLDIGEPHDAIIVSSDTLVELDGKPLGKPQSREHARQMLSELSGKRHNVHTGIAVHCNGRLASGTATTGVIFREISGGEIEEYIESGEPMDKAGAYAIQGLGGRFVKGFEGDFDTVVGFSVKLFGELLASLGIDIEELK